MNKRKYTTLLILLCIQFIAYSQKENKLAVFKTDSKLIYGMCFTNNGKKLAIADNNNIKLFSTNTKELITEFKNGHKDLILTIDISKDSTLLVSGGKDSLIIIWDFNNNKILKSLTFQKGIITSLQISPSGKYLISGGTDNKVYLYNILEDKLIREYTNHSDIITSVKFSPDEKLFISSSGDKTINIYEVNNGNLITTLFGHKNWIRDVSFSMDGRKIISCDDDSKILKWDISNTNKIQQISNYKSNTDWIMSVDYNEDNESYVYGDFDGNALIIFPFGKYSTCVNSPINKVLFIPNEKFYLKIVIATRGKGVFLVDARNMK